jgi:CheY-like chemotaxis protein
MPTVLLIDDDPDFVEATCAVLESAPYKVLVAYSGTEGFTTAQKAQPDVIILDVIMPGEDGFQILERLRADPVLADTPVMMLTSLPNGLNVAPESDTSARVKEHVEEYIEKPVRPAELLRRVERLLRLQNAQLFARNSQIQ